MASLFQKHARALGFLALVQLATGPLVLGLICCLTKIAVQTTEDCSSGVTWEVSVHRAVEHMQQLPAEVIRAQAALESNACDQQCDGKARPTKSTKNSKSKTWTTGPWLVLQIPPRRPDAVMPITERPPSRMEWPHAPPIPPPKDV